MKLLIDASLCQAQKRCFNLYADLFAEGDDGKGVVLTQEVPEELEFDAQLAVNACPFGAISLVDEETGG